jgi:2-hydroxychromene-2-carboxylate isomerase
LLTARVALVGFTGDWGERFCRAAFQAEFGDGRPIEDAGVLGDILAQLNVAAAPVFEAAHGDDVKAALRRQTEEAQRLGIFGAPSFTTEDGELFWGNDRLERALAWARDGR